MSNSWRVKCYVIQILDAIIYIGCCLDPLFWLGALLQSMLVWELKNGYTWVFTKTGPLKLGKCGDITAFLWKWFLQLSGFGLLGSWRLVSVPNRRERLSWKGNHHFLKKNCTEWLSVNSCGGQIMVRKWEIHGDSITTFTRAPNQLLIGSGLIMVVTQI